MHSIKGIAATAGLAEVGRVAHQTETLLDHARSGRVSIEDRFVETLEEAANAISESLSAAAAGSDAAPAAELIQSFHDLDTEDTAEVELPLPELPADLATAINDGERLLLLEALRENEKLYFVTADFDLAVFDKQFNELRSLITRHGAVISSLPSAGGAHPDRRKRSSRATRGRSGCTRGSRSPGRGLQRPAPMPQGRCRSALTTRGRTSQATTASGTPGARSR